MVAVLVVEADEATRSLAGLALQEHGFEVHVAANGTEALTRLASPLPIAILFTELDLDGMCGRELARRARMLRGELRVLFTTEGRAVPDRGEVAAPGAAFLPKIYSMNALVSAVMALLAG